MSEQSSEHADADDEDGPLSITDDELPEDLRPSEDNPLAQPADDDVPEDLLHRTPRSGSGGDSEDADKGGGDASGASSGEASSEAQSDELDDAARLAARLDLVAGAT